MSVVDVHGFKSLPLLLSSDFPATAAFSKKKSSVNPTLLNMVEHLAAKESGNALRGLSRPEDKSSIVNIVLEFPLDDHKHHANVPPYLLNVKMGNQYECFNWA